MQILNNPVKSNWPELVKRPDLGHQEVHDSVSEILRQVKDEGDSALRKYGKLFDNYEQVTFQVSEQEIQTSAANLSKDLISAIDQAAKNIAHFHSSQQERAQIVETMPGVKCWRQSRPIERVGFYAPAGSAPLFSSVLMLGVPARIAGCKEMVLCAPPSPAQDEFTINPVIAYCAKLLEIREVYAIGGAQAIAAMAYGTESIARVHKIFGPGNRYVTCAKQIVSSQGVAIDLPAGPSELLVIADDSCNPEFVAADLLSQAEHGEDSQVVLLASSKEVLDQVLSAIDGQITRLDRQTIARAALEKSLAITFSELGEAIEFTNLYAPEHLILATRTPHSLTDFIINAGSVFLGHYTPESAGDYASGTNHTLPTAGHAAALSGVSLDSFVKKLTFQEITKEGLTGLAPTILTMAEAEGLEAHKEAVKIRIK